MKKITLLFLISFTSFGQYLKSYYPLINEAELAIVDSNYHKALTLYRTAFSAVEKPQSADYENAAKCAFLTFEEASGKYYLRKMANDGYSENYLKSDVQHLLFRDAFADAAFAKDMKSRYNDFIINQQKAYKKDSTITDLLGKLWKRSILEKGTKNKAEIERINQLFSDFLTARWKIGVDFTDQLENALVVQLLQDESVSFTTKKLDKTLISAIDAGNLSPVDAYSILTVRGFDFLKKSERLLTKISVNAYVCDDKESIEKLLDKWLIDSNLFKGKDYHKINEIRMTIGHESLEDELKKRVHSMRCNDECNFDLRCPRNYIHYPTTCDETKKLIEGLDIF